ncbi:MAG: hypothetical protein J3R72DRAFT_2398 [Linnemannia gamsii]|nr:MAG: hypothetical protein J3R72DRAFT_2398 [Linnemannia gamsii]
MSGQTLNIGEPRQPGYNRNLAESLTRGEFDHVLLPVFVQALHFEDGIGYGSSLFGLCKLVRRTDYIALLETAAPPVRIEAMHAFRQIVAAYDPPASNRNNTLQQEDHIEVSNLIQCGSRRLPENLKVMHVGLTDSTLLEANKQTRSVVCVLGLVDEVMTHRLGRRECGKFAMRNLQLMHHVATIAAEQAKGDVASWFFGVIDWCIRVAHSIENRTDFCDSCYALLLEIGTMRVITIETELPNRFLDNHAINVLRQSAAAVCAFGLMFSGLPASTLIFQAARLEFWYAWSFGLDKPVMSEHTNIRSMVAESGRQAGLCYGRVYQWTAANWQHGYSFTEWCALKRLPDMALQTRDIVDVQHLDCVDKCMHGRSATAGHIGHMPWCKEHSICAVTRIPEQEQGGGGLLVFDSIKEGLRNLRSGESYVAVSHVWGQRLFGQDTRTLGRCTIAELRRLANVNRVACIWLDTLCIPSEPVARRICIDGMRAIYKNAACVAVYDRGIMKADRMDRTGFAFEVSISDWNSRVWTLQEGYLNSVVVYVQEEVYIPHRRIHVNPFLQWHSVAMAYDMLRHIGDGGRAIMQPHEVFRSAAGRTTSHAVDYVCGLGALLPEPIRRVGADLTLAAIDMARMLGKMDIGVLCSYCPRVQMDGYHWMPLGCQDLSAVHEYGVIGSVLGDDGLYLESEALHIGELSRIENPSVFLQNLQSSRGGHLHTSGTIDVLVPDGADLEGSYDFVCAMSNGRTALGFLVAVQDDACKYVTPATIMARNDHQLRFTKNVYVIG